MLLGSQKLHLRPNSYSRWENLFSAVGISLEDLSFAVNGIALVHQLLKQSYH